jgi:hypothetical protein
VGALLAACDSGTASEDTTSTTAARPTTSTTTDASTTTSTSTSSTSTTSTTTTLPLVEPATIADYLLIVLRASRDSGVNEATAELLVAPDEAAYGRVLEGLRTNLAELQRVLPPPEAEEFHGLLVDQALAAVGLYEELLDAIAAGDSARIEELAGESLRAVGDAAEIGVLQLELLETALEGRDDAVASYVLDMGALGVRLSGDIEGFIERFDEVLAGEEDLELLARVADEEALLLLALADEFAGLHPPQVGAEYHVAQMRAAGGVGGGLARMAAAIRDDDIEAFQGALQSLFGFIASATSALDAQQDLLIEALEGVVEDDGRITWARVPIGTGNTFGFVTDVIASPEGVIAFGSPDRFESRNGPAWFAVPATLDLLTESMTSGLALGEMLLAVGSVRSTSSRDAAVWRSLDGLTWERLGEEALSADGDESMVDIATGQSGYVAVGYAGSSQSDEPRLGSIWYSSDLASWERTEFATGADDPDGLRGVAYGNGRYVTVGAGVWTSTNGRDWNEVSVPEVERLNTVRHTDVGFVAVGVGPDESVVVLSSPDGEVWTQSTEERLPAGDVVLTDVTDIGDRLLAVGFGATASGEQGLVVWESTDGLSWAGVTLPEDVAEFGTPIAITAGGPGVVIVGAGRGESTAWLGFVP